MIESDNVKIEASAKRFEYANWTTILNTTSIANDTAYNPALMRARTFCEDVLLGCLSYLKNQELYSLDDNFYYYCENNGVTSELDGQKINEIISGFNA